MPTYSATSSRQAAGCTTYFGTRSGMLRLASDAIHTTCESSQSSPYLFRQLIASLCLAVKDRSENSTKNREAEYASRSSFTHGDGLGGVKRDARTLRQHSDWM